MSTAPPKWLVSACLCDCDKVALTILEGCKLDPEATLTADDDNEVVATGDDWRDLYRPVALEMATRTGRPISGCCTTVVTGGDNTGIEDAVTQWAYASANVEVAA